MGKSAMLKMGGSTSGGNQVDYRAGESLSKPGSLPDRSNPPSVQPGKGNAYSSQTEDKETNIGLPPTAADAGGHGPSHMHKGQMSNCVVSAWNQGDGMTMPPTATG